MTVLRKIIKKISQKHQSTHFNLIFFIFFHFLSLFQDLFYLFTIVYQLIIFLYFYLQPQMVPTFFLPLFFILIQSQVSAYSIQGTWKITHIQENQLKQPTQIQIKSFAFRNQTLRWSLAITKCFPFKMMMDIRGKDIFLDLSTIYYGEQKSQNCSSQAVIRKNFEKVLRKVYAFKIIYNYMIFSDPGGQVLFKFQRVPPQNLHSRILGIWRSRLTNGPPIGQIIEISEQSILLCQKKVQLQYNLSSNKISSSIVTVHNSCKDSQLLNIFRNSLYFAKRKSSLEFYNEEDKLIATLEFIMSLQAAKKIQQQEAKKKELMASPPPPTSLSSLLSPVMNSQKQIVFSDLMGKWTITQIFGGPNIIKEITFIITANALLISTNCNTYTFSFRIEKQIPITLKRQGFKQTINKCSNEDEAIYKNGLLKTSILKPQVFGDLLVVKIQDVENNELFTIQKQYVFSNKSRVAAPQIDSNGIKNQLPVIQEKKNNLFDKGRYTILLLKRRDLPRKFLTMSENSFTIKFCSSYIVSFELVDDKIKLSPSLKEQQSCNSSDQQVYLSTMKNVTNFKQEDQVVILLDSNGVELITLNFIG